MTSKIKYPTIWRPLIYSGLSTALHNCAYCDIYEWNSVCSAPLASYDITTEKQWRRKSCFPLFDANWFIRDSQLHCTTVHIVTYTSEIVSAAHHLQAMTSQQRSNDVGKSSIPLFDAPWFIRDSQLHCTTVHIVTYTSEIVSAAHHLQAMTSQQRRQWRRKSSIPLFDALWFIRDSQLHCTTVHIVTYTSEIVSAAHHFQAMTSQQRSNDVENQVSHYLTPSDLFGTPNCIAQPVHIVTYTSEIVSAAHHLQAMTSQQRSNDVENQVSHYLTPPDLFGTLNCIAQLCILWHIRVK